MTDSTTTQDADSEPAARIDHAAILPKRTKWIVLFGVLLSLFLAALDQTIVTTALPAIVRDFKGIDLISWVSTAYLLASTAMVPIYGKLSDLYGRKRVLMVGIVVFLLGSVACGFAGTMLLLIWARVLQGLGAAAITSTALATPADLFAPAERSKYMGLFGGVYGLASVIGPFVGGVLTDRVGWHWVFFVNVPVGVVAMYFVWRKMPNLASGLRVKIDWLGTVVLVIAVVAWMLGLSVDKQQYGWGSGMVIGLFAVAVVFSVIFVMVESVVEHPVISLKLFRNPTFRVGIVASVLNGIAFFGAVIFLSLFMVNVLGRSATEAGTAQIPLMVAFVLSSNVASLLVHRLGRYKPLIVLGFGIMSIGFVCMMGMGAETTMWGVMWRTFVVGLGIGPAMPLLNLAIQNAVSFEQIGSATASRQFFQQMGQAMGGAVFGLVLTMSLHEELGKNLRELVGSLPSEERAQLKVGELRHSVGREGMDEGGGDVVGSFRKGMMARLEGAKVRVASKSVEQVLADGEVPEGVKRVLCEQGLEVETRRARLAQVWQDEQSRVEAEVMTVGTEVKQAVKESFATSITHIYRYTLGLSLLAMVWVLWALPELPLRKSNS